MDEIKIKQKAFSNPELAAFCGQLSLILHSGISSLEGISILLEDSKDPEEQAVLQRLLERLQETGSLATAFADAGLFPAYLLSMTELGEQTGTLDEVMKALSLHYEREEAISRNVKNALTYPLIMSAVMAAVIVILLVKVMPIFQQVFRQLGTEMTGFSRVLMGLGTALNRYSILFIVLLLLVIAAAFAGTHTAGGRRFFRKIGLHFSRIRSMQEQLSVCRFASGMAISLKSGLTQEQSLELTERLIEDTDFCKKLEACRNGLSEGQDSGGSPASGADSDRRLRADGFHRRPDRGTGYGTGTNRRSLPGGSGRSDEPDPGGSGAYAGHHPVPHCGRDSAVCDAAADGHPVQSLGGAAHAFSNGEKIPATASAAFVRLCLRGHLSLLLSGDTVPFGGYGPAAAGQP